MSADVRSGTAAMTVKRAADVVGAIVLLALLSPLTAAIALSIRVRMGKPVIFKQPRPGRHEQPFTMFKFRTMSEESSEDGAPLPDHLRLTNLGRALRATSLDEIPQLINVLRGDMSFVGPRPLLMRYLPYFNERERLRFAVRPGITGLAQVSGRNALGWSDRLELDICYVQRWSLWLDLRIASRTVWAILRREGFQEDPGANMMDLDQDRAGKEPTIE